MNTKTHQKRRVGFIVFPGVTALDFVGPMEAFAAAVTTESGRKEPCYELVTIALGRRRVRGESGLEVHADCTLDSAPALDTVLIPGGHGLREPAMLSRLSAWLKERQGKTRRIAAVCTGIYGLAASGLLEDRRVTTHWAFAQDVAQRFPTLRVDPNALFLKDGKFYTSAGVTAGIDLSLALIEEDCGPAVALAVARELVVYIKRPGDQAQFSEPLQFQTRTGDRFADLVAWLMRNPQHKLSTEILAKRMNLGARHFSRSFKRAYGLAPMEFVEGLRIKEACKRLLLPRASVETVARSVGFSSADVFRRAFERRIGVAPGSYRARFSRQQAG